MKKKSKGQPIGFLLGSPHSPHPTSPCSLGFGSVGFPQGSGDPSLQNQSIPTLSGFGGMLDNAQKWMGMVQQFGPLVKNLSPMLQLLRGINISGNVSEGERFVPISGNKVERRIITRQKRRLRKR